ncbi:MAG: ATP-binding protein [Verrucomicrobiaceae bacterium]|nr:MAG: ATP-binding protein [Verrucomicrobiaceae bacterium]
MKALVGREVAFPIEVAPQSEQTVFMRFEDPRGPYARLLWWPESAAFHLSCQRDSLAEGLYFGGLLALLAYNVLLWVRLRQSDIRLYVCYLASGAVFVFLARAHFGTLGWPLATPELEKLLSASMALSGFFLVCFAREFLELETRFPGADIWLRKWSHIMIALSGVLLVVPSGMVGAGMTCAVAATGLTHAGLVVLVAVIWGAGFRQARFFAVAFGCLFAGSLLMVGVWFFEDTLRDAGMRGLMIGSALEMLMLSLAVSDRFARTQEELVEETEQRRMMEEAYSQELENEVNERTRELLDANTEKDRILAVIGHDLRGPLASLMRSADDPCRDIRKDVTQTGRALLLMIEDLVLWTRLRAGTRATSPHLVSALVKPAVALHHSLAEHGGVELLLDMREDRLIQTDLVLAQTLVRNLLANALKFARTRVIIRTCPVDGGIRLLVGNDGPPLSPAVAARLAAGEDEPITATGGMGLKLCREICQALHMPLEANLPPEGGTEFGFTLRTDDE